MRYFDIKCIITAAETGGSASVFEENVPPGYGPPLHIHREQTEIYHIIEGEFEFVVGNDRLALGAGDAAVVPPGVPHAFKNTSSSTGKLHFELLPPGNSEEFFHRLADEFESIDDIPDVPALFDQYGIDLVGAPPGQ